MYGFRVAGLPLIGASRLPPKIFSAAEYCRRADLGAAAYHAGISGGEVIAPWLHDPISISGTEFG